MAAATGAPHPAIAGPRSPMESGDLISLWTCLVLPGTPGTVGTANSNTPTDQETRSADGVPMYRHQSVRRRYTGSHGPPAGPRAGDRIGSPSEEAKSSPTSSEGGIGPATWAPSSPKDEGATRAGALRPCFDVRGGFVHLRRATPREPTEGLPFGLIRLVRGLIGSLASKRSGPL